MKKAFNTGKKVKSHQKRQYKKGAVTHVSTNQPARCLTPVIGLG